MAADAASLWSGARHSQRRGWLGMGGREEGRETIFGTSKKYLRRHLAALFICRARFLLHHNRRPVVIVACACSHVCTCTHPVLCTPYTHGDTVCALGHTPHRPPASLPCPGAQLPKMWGCCHPARWVLWGQHGHRCTALAGSWDSSPRGDTPRWPSRFHGKRAVQPHPMLNLVPR